jgi:hypothetical protein
MYEPGTFLGAFLTSVFPAEGKAVDAGEVFHVSGEQHAVSLEADAGDQRVRHPDRLSF